MLFGHAIAKAALRVSLASKAIELMRRTVGESDKRIMMRDLLGYDPNVPLVPRNTLAYQAIIAGEIDDVFSTEQPE